MDWQDTRIVNRFLRNSFWLLPMALAVACNTKPKVSLPYITSPDFTPIWLEDTTLKLSDLHTIQDFVFTNQLGEPVTQETMTGKVSVVNFFFTICPSICPRMMDNLTRVQETFKGNDVVQLSMTVMPETDSVPKLKDYAEAHGIDVNKWHLLTGDKTELYQTARQSFFADEELGKKVGEYDFIHTETATLVDKEGRIRGIYNSTLPLEIDRLIDDIKLLLKE